jgi:uncharacterized protein YukE
MALDINGATVGYDHAGIDTLLRDIKANVIEEAKEKLKSSEATLDESLDNIWQGKSEETFKNNMHQDVLVVCDALDKAYDTLAAEIYRTGSAMGQVDEGLVESY